MIDAYVFEKWKGRICMRQPERYASVGVFDSGVGGLTVVKEIMHLIPGERVVYFGDTARVPYGSKSKETVTKFSKQDVNFLLSMNVKAIVAACNTASAVALDEIEKEIPVPIIGVVKPGAKAAVEMTRNKKIGVIATEATIHSEIYTKYIQKIAPDTEITGKACPLFVPLVEEGLLEDSVTDEIARRYLTDLKGTGIDALILGCTHYPLIRSTIARVMGKDVTLVNPAYETARSLKELLTERNLLNDSGTAVEHQFFVSDSADKIRIFANAVLPYEITTAERINIEEY